MKKRLIMMSGLASLLLMLMLTGCSSKKAQPNNDKGLDSDTELAVPQFRITFELDGAEPDSTVDHAILMMLARLESAGLKHYHIERIKGTSRIEASLPDSVDHERFARLLNSSGNLEFWETYYYSELQQFLPQFSELSGKLHVSQPSDYSVAMGMAYASDTAAISSVLSSPKARRVLPTDVKWLWAVNSIDGDNDERLYELYAIKMTDPSGNAPLDSRVITKAEAETDARGLPCVYITMNAEGARLWANMTRQNIGRCIAMVYNGAVYSIPRVNDEIESGRSMISGMFTQEECQDLANAINTAIMSASLRIVKTETIMP